MRKFLTIVFLLAFAAWNSYGQVASGYNFSSTVGTYTEITGGTVWQTGTWDDQTGTVPVGFNFSANGSTVSSVFASANGYIHTGTSSFSYTPISSTGVASFVASAFGRDLQGQAAGEIRYETSGTAPNRVFTMQWKNAKRYGSSYADETLNFQLKLYETSNKVEFVYGACIGTTYASPTHPQVGLRGTTNTDFFNRTTTTNWSASTPGASNTATMTVTSAVVPANGLTYSYTLVPPGVAVIGSPANGANGILTTATLNWTPGVGGLPGGYNVYFGTDNPPTNIANGVVVTSPTYDPTPDMAYNTTYYWRVVAFNGGGTAASTPVWSFTTLAGFGSLEGIVKNFNGVAVAGATVAAVGPATYNTTTNASGFYQFLNIPAATYTVGAQAATYNTTTIPGVVVSPFTTTTQDIVLLQPSMNITPSPNQVTVNPNEVLNNQFTITNLGTGTLGWTASIGNWSSSNHSWFSMPTVSGSVNAASIAQVPAIFNASGLPVGTVLSATVTFASTPNVGTQAVDVQMIVAGAELVPVTNVVGTLTNQFTGDVTLTWECNPSPGLLYYNVKRDGVTLAAVPSATTYNDVLPTYGTYDYCVNAVYADGTTAPVCTSVEWANPTMTWTPSALANTQPSGSTQPVALTLGNTGLGTLAFEFPDYTDNSGDSPLAYCTATATACDEYIGKVTFGTINNTTGCNNYANYTAISTDAVKGTVMPMTVLNGGNAYSSDYLYVWIDYDHNDVFDGAELTQLATLGGGSNFSGNISIPLTAMSGPTTMRVRMSYATSANPCGSQTYGEVEDYTVNIKAPTFITAVAPASGFVSPGGTQPVSVYFSATDDYAPAGVYVKPLALESNDLANASVNITCTMTVYVPGTISGVVTDGVSGDLLPGVMVSAGGNNVAMTGDNGEYTMVLQAGTYNLTFSKIGYQNATATGVVVTAGNATTVNAQMFEEPYAPSCATAVVNAEDTQSTVTWCVPAGPYELLYDDGTAENYAAWQLPGNMNAVKFTPKGYPAHVIGAKLFVGDGSFPAGGVVAGAEFGVAVYSAGADGMPNQMLDSVPASVTNFGWVNVSGLNATVNSGDFFIVMIQGSQSPDCAPIGVDETQPKAFKSYSRNVGTNSPWVLSPYQDFMMHAVVSSPLSGDDAMEVAANVVPGKVAGMISQSKPMAVAGQTGMSAMVTAPEGYDNMDLVHHYSLSRISLGPVTPVPPASGVFTLLNNNITATTYTEGGTTWSALPQGWYAYGVKAVYPNAQESEFVYTNAVPHKMFADVTVNVQLICGFVPAEGAFVSLTGNNYPYDVYSATVPASGTVFFDNVIKGVYDLLVTRAGYYATGYKVTINGNKTIDVVLEDIRYKPRNLMVECGTLVATWDEPLAIAVQEDFEGGVFPPSGWQATTQGSVGWYATTDGSSGYFSIPGHTTYAVANDDEGGSANNGCCDYLITPELDLTNGPSYVLSFQSFYNGDYGQMAYVEMSTDAGASWTPIYTCEPAATWQQVDIDLSAYSGAAGLSSVWFTFHADDAGQWASGWAIDDVVIASGGVPVQGYGVFLDGTVVAETQELTYTYNPGTITYGQTYVAGVAGKYCSGYSELETYTFTSCFLYPPRNLEGVFNGSTTSGAAILTWEAPLAGDKKGMSYQEYITLNNITPFNSNEPTSKGIAPFINPSTLPEVNDAMSVATTKAWGALYQDQYVNFTLDNPGSFTTFGSATPNAFIMEAEIINGVYYACDENGSWFSMDTVTGVVTTLGSTGNPDLTSLAWDPTTSVLYGIDFNGGFYTVDVATGALTSIGSTNSSVIAASCDVSGNIYAVDMTLDAIGMVDKATGAWTTLAPLGFNANYGQDMTTDFQTNTLYYGAYNASLGAGQEYTFEPATNALTLVGNFQGNAQLMGFAVPVKISGGGGGVTGLVAYRLYRDDAAIQDIPPTELTYWDLNLMPATYCYDITAVYDIEPYGFPAGSTAESVKEGTACVDVMYGFELPFTEDWTTGQFDVNLWTVGPNWVMDGQAGNPMPSAKFKWDPLLTDYESSLESFYMNAAAINTTTPYKIWLDFDLKLDDRTASTNELLTVEVWNGSSWSEVKEYANNGDFDWTPEHVNISSAAKGNVFKVRFRANGDLTGDIFYWAVDNIHIYVGYEFNPPLNLVATSEGTPKNDIKLTWSAPEGGGTVMTYVLDDNSAENGWGINAGADAWLGNEFVVTENGVLQSFDLYFQTNASSGNYPMTVDIFDASQTLVGTSAEFVPVADNWVTVAVNDVPFNGTFYAMVHWNMLPGSSHWFGSDENGPNAAANYGWYYDGAAWAHLSDFGYAPNVFMIRAKALVGGDKAVATFGPSSNSNGTANASLLSKSGVSSSAGVPVSSSAIYLGDNSDALTGYNVWRRAYAVFPAGQNTAGAGDFVKINTAIVVPTEYLDLNLSNLETNCYEYQVTAVYDEGESAPSNIDWECIFVGVNPNEANEVKVYPNPATTYVRIDLTKEVTQISVYNALGSVVAEKNVKGETTITLNTSNYAAGAYSVKFTTTSGESFSRKFVVTK